MGIFFPGGRLAEDDGNCGITRLMTRVMARGPGDRSPAQFYRQLEIYGGQVTPVVAPDYFGFRFSILSRNFDAGLGLLFELIKTPAFDGDEIDRQKEIQSQEILWSADSPAGALEQVHQALFPNSPYALSAAGTPASLSSITRDSLQKWYDNCVRNRKPVVVAVGDTKGTSLASYFVRHFSGSRMQDAKIPGEHVRPPEKGQSIRKAWKRNQSFIFVGFQAPPEDDEDRCAAAVLAGYAGEYGRLGQEARERRGVAYSVSALYEPRLRGGSIILAAALNPGNEEAVLKTLQEEIRRWIEAPIPFRDYRSAVNAAAGSYWIRSQARWDQISDMAANLIAGKGMEAYLNYPVRLQQVGEEEFAEAAGRILNLERAVILRMEGTPNPNR
jgi:predicted Zn-dependent peptidase